jgi:hypothetical protein
MRAAVAAGRWATKASIPAALGIKSIYNGSRSEDVWLDR